MSDEQLACGSQLGQYQIGERIAAGGMAEIYHAICLVPGRVNRPIVLKRMHQHLANDSKFVSMFVEEARISARLDHPNIVQLFDFEATSDGLYIILEYIDGPDLLSLLKAGARRRMGMPAEIAVYICCHLLEALDYAHTTEINGRLVGIVHKDVSPGNILISHHGRVKLADFGIARASDRHQEIASGTLKGKYGYMSPEQLEAEELDGRADIYSAGVVLAELLMSKRLFTSPNPLDVLVMVRNADLSRLDMYGTDIDPALQTILRRALERTREARFDTAAEFRDQLAGWLASRKTRMSTTVLKKYISELESGGFLIPAVRGDATGSITMSGTATRATTRAALSDAKLGRRLYEQADPEQEVALGAAGITVLTSGSSILANAGVERNTSHLPISAKLALEQKSGTLQSVLPLDLIGYIYTERLTGLLTVARDTVVKKIYFADGHPTMVDSNDPAERLGQFLIRRKLITDKQLHRALTTTPHFGGHLGNALVGLGLLHAVDAMQLLSDQASDKLLNSACWDEGRFSWQADEVNPDKSLELKLNSCKLVAQSVQRLPDAHIVAWIDARRNQKPNLAAVAPYDAFRFGPSLSKRLLTMDGTRSVDDLISSVRGKSIRVLGAALYSVYACYDEFS
ncbi:MAG: serine/threonine protein kinase [Kofleriaceae bacterium]|nr:serine/threonine protein kinase [Kofleriaceae bacterium]